MEYKKYIPYIAMVVIGFSFYYLGSSDSFKNLDLLNTNKLEVISKKQEKLSKTISLLQTKSDSLQAVIVTNSKELEKYKYRLNEINRKFNARRNASISSSPNQRSSSVTNWINSD